MVYFIAFAVSEDIALVFSQKSLFEKITEVRIITKSVRFNVTLFLLNFQKHLTVL